MTFLAALAAKIVEFILNRLVLTITDWYKAERETIAKNAELKRQTTILINAVKTAKTDEEIKNAAKNISDYIANLPPR